MAEEGLRYERMMEDALRQVVRAALEKVAVSGLPGDHHFFISFRTAAPGVQIPAYLKEQYPGEMTIVLQYQFYGLDVDDRAFNVTLSFNNVHERLQIPFAAITTFADPSANFVLQFRPAAATEADAYALPADDADATAEAGSGDEPDGDGPEDGGPGATSGTVVALDAFRKKQS